MSSPSPSNGRPPSTRSKTSNQSRRSTRSEENTPLLSRSENDEGPLNVGPANGVASPAEASLYSIQNNKAQRRLPTIISLCILTFLLITILGIGFAAPAIVEEYAREALVFEPNNLSLDSITATGVRARVQGTFVLDASRVQKKPVRDLGRAGTWIAREVESGASELKVYLPQYDNVLVGIAKVPPIKVNIQDGHYNHIDFLTDLEPGDVEGVRRIANDWLDGRLESLQIEAVASLPLRSGLFKLGTQSVTQSMFFEGHDLPSFPRIEINKLEVDDGPSGQGKGMLARAAVSVMNDYPVKVDIPPLRFAILVPNCQPDEKYLLIGDAKTDVAHVMPKQFVDINVVGQIQQLPESLTTACPASHRSPLDSLLAEYLQGNDTTVFVRGNNGQDRDTPDWMTGILKDTTVPFPLPGHPFDNLIRNFSLTNVHFNLPDPLSEPDSPGSQPRISATVNALVGLPKEMNFDLDVDRVRTEADIFYHGKKLGKLDMLKWQEARTSKVGSDLLIESDIDKAPLRIEDDDVFTEVIEALVFSGKGVVLTVKALVNVNTVTALGEFVVREIPAEGGVFVKPLTLSKLKPQIGQLRVVDTSKSSVTLQARVNVSNPTDYSAHIPFMNISMSNNDTVLGYGIAKDVDVVPGNNTNLLVNALWMPENDTVGRQFLSQYISGLNTTLTLRTHEASIPTQPALGRALSGLKIVVDTPDLFGQKTPGHSGPSFIDDATMHLISSTATFTLRSPLPSTTLYITALSATAFYNHTEPVGTIDYAYMFAVPPGRSTTPRLPVDWSPIGAGRDAVRDALGGSLKLDAVADVGVKVGDWNTKIHFVGGGIGASIRL